VVDWLSLGVSCWFGGPLRRKRVLTWSRMASQVLAAHVGQFDLLAVGPDAHHAHRAALLPRAPVLPTVALRDALKRHGGDKVPGIVDADDHQQQERRADDEQRRRGAARQQQRGDDERRVGGQRQDGVELPVLGHRRVDLPAGQAPRDDGDVGSAPEAAQPQQEGDGRERRPAQCVEDVAHLMPPLRRRLRQQAQIRGHKGPFFISDITDIAGVGASGHAPYSTRLATSVHNTL